MKATVIIYQFPRQLKDGSFPLFVRATFNRKSKYFKLSLSCARNQWDQDAQRFRQNYADYRKKNDLLLAIEKRASDYLYQTDRNGEPFSFEALALELFPQNRKTGGESLPDFITWCESVLIGDGKHGTAETYKDLGIAIGQFKPKSQIADIDPVWLEDFDRWLRTQRKNKDGGVAFQMRVLRAVCNRAVKAKIMPKGWAPFGEYKISRLKKGKGMKALTMADFRKIESAEVSGRLAFCRDMFLLSFYARGANFADLIELTDKNIIGNRIIYERQKTKSRHSIKFDGIIRQIIERWTDPGDSHLIPVLQDGKHVTYKQRKDRKDKVAKQINAGIREVARLVGVHDERLSFYSSRHSAATELKRRGVGINVIQEFLGHESPSTTENYALLPMPRKPCTRRSAYVSQN